MKQNLQLLAKQMRKSPTKAEEYLWRFLKKRQLGYKFRRQHIIGRYIVDFISLELKLVIELDGFHHLKQAPDDEERTKFLNSRDFHVLRFWNEEVLNDVLETIERIKEYIVYFAFKE